MGRRSGRLSAGLGVSADPRRAAACDRVRGTAPISATGSATCSPSALPSIPLPDEDTLFVGADVYAWRAVDEQSVCASWIGLHIESFTLCRQPAGPTATSPTTIRKRIAGNRDIQRTDDDRCGVVVPGRVAHAGRPDRTRGACCAGRARSAVPHRSHRSCQPSPPCRRCPPRRPRRPSPQFPRCQPSPPCRRCRRRRCRPCRRHRRCRTTRNRQRSAVAAGKEADTVSAVAAVAAVADAAQ